MPELIAAIGEETPDFAVEASRKEPLKKSVTSIGMGILMGVFLGPFVSAWMLPIFGDGTVTMTVNNVKTQAGSGNFWIFILPLLIISVFIAISANLIISGIINLFSRGGFFVGTPTRLISYRRGTLQSVDWEQFNGNILVKRDDITLEMRTGHMERAGKHGSQYVADIMYIAGIPNAFEIEGLCRQRIKNNDPTPTPSA